MKDFDVTALGELLIDFTENGISEQGNPLLEANPGGAPCNVLAMLSKLGRKTAFIGKVGNDIFGRQLRQAILEEGIDTAYLQMDDKTHTTLAFVQKKPNGDRDFSFYRDPGADMMLEPEEIHEDIFQRTRIFHFGSLSMTHPSNRQATRKALQFARKNGCLISFDPNLREPLWDSLEHAREQIAYGMGFCDVLKISDNELQWFSGKDDFDEGIAILKNHYHIPLILLSKGRDGSSAYYRDFRVDAEPFLQENTIETTGAGDTFCACVLHYILDHDIHELDRTGLRKMLTFANAAASLITTRKGALRVMPSREEILSLVESRAK